MDKLAAMRAFVQVVNARSFTAAGAHLAVGVSAVTKSVARLEKSLGVRLLNRTTHGVALTDEGAVYFERCVKLLDELAGIEQQLAQRHASPSGQLRVSLPYAMGRVYVIPLLPKFFAAHPGLNLQLVLADQVADLIEDELDVALRVGSPRDSRTVARLLVRTRRVTCASPTYLARYGRPSAIEDLRDHNCLTLLFNGRRRTWHFARGKSDLPFIPSGNLVVNSGDALREAVLAGVGVAQCNTILVAPELRSGALVPILSQHDLPSDSVYAVYPQNRHMLPRVRAFLAFLDETFAPYRDPLATRGAKAAQSKAVSRAA